MSWARTLLAFVVFAFLTSVLGIMTIVLSLLTLRTWHRTDLVSQLWGRLVLLVCGVRLRVRGLENLDPKAHYVMIANHESYLDVPVILASLPQKVRFVTKRSLFYAPIFGQVLWITGHIPVDRRNASDAKQRLRKYATRVGRLVSVLFFPEGTRTSDGELQKFRKGAAVMALDTQVAVLPLAVAGTRSVLPRGFHAISPGPVGLAIGRPIVTKGRTSDERKALTEELEQTVRALRREAEQARDEAATAPRDKSDRLSA